jgi:DHA1 family bicyclomycin/chloramphenicol resistance-like MFS transporter
VIFILGFGYFLGTIFNRKLLSLSTPLMLALCGLFGMTIFSLLLLGLTWKIKLNLLTLIVPTWFIFFFSGLVFPNSMTKSIELFPNCAGMVSALFGTGLGIIVFAVTSLVCHFKIHSQMGVSVVFIIINFLMILGYCINLYAISANDINNSDIKPYNL